MDDDGWKPFPAETLDRVFVAGVQPQSGTCPAYWWHLEDVTDGAGMPIEYKNAKLWHPIPNLPKRPPE